MQNPAENVSLPKAENTEITLFTSVETARIKSAALKGNSYEIGILLTLFTGLRIGELCALTWGNIDLVRQIIHINKTLYRIANPQGTAPKTVVVIDSPKSKSSVRDIPIPTFMLTALARQKRGQPDNNYFLTCSSGYTEPRSYALRYRTFLKRLNIPYRKFHSLRHLNPPFSHFSQTTLLRQNIPLQKRQMQASRSHLPFILEIFMLHKYNVLLFTLLIYLLL